MSYWVAGSVLVSGYLANESNEDAANTAANAVPQFPRELQGPISDTVGDITGAPDVQPFQGPRVAPFSPFQQQGLNQTPELARVLAGLNATTAQGFQSFASGEQIGNNPFLDQAISGLRETGLRDLSRNQLPAIRNNAVNTGGIGGSRQGIAEGIAISDLNRDLTNTEASLRSSQFNKDISNQLQALTGQGQILSGQGADQRALLASGGLQQQQQQSEFSAIQQLFEENQNLNFDRDSEILRILLGAPAAVPPTPNVTNPLVAGLGAGITAQQLFTPQAQPTTVVNTGATNTNNPSITNAVPSV